MDDGFCASSGGESELVRHACSMEVAGIRLCQASGNQLVEEVADNNAPNSAIWFLECYYPAQPDGLADLVGNVGFGKACGHRDEVL